ncbi:hypothetical protein ABW21_db0206271 [Orbilia brochopaga]|nr:hypothetical protein ABW21_db0206271 [Drechslerella brochopaga]
MLVRRSSQFDLSMNPAVAIDDSELGKDILLDDQSTASQPAVQQGVVKIPTYESLQAANNADANVDPALGNRGASSDAGASTEADADAGDVVPHRLEDTYPSRPSPIKDEPADTDASLSENDGDAGTQDLSEGDGDHTDGYPEHQMDTSDDDEWNHEEEEALQLIEMGGFPLGMLGPVMDAPGSELADTGILEIDIGPEMMMASGGGDGMVEEIWITDGTPASHGGFESGLDSLAEEIEVMMQGLTGTFVKDPAQVAAGQDIATATDIARIDPANVREGWSALGGVVGIVAMSVLLSLVVITGLGCGAAVCIAKRRARRRGYREVEERLNTDEDWM